MIHHTSNKKSAAHLHTNMIRSRDKLEVENRQDSNLLKSKFLHFKFSKQFLDISKIISFPTTMYEQLSIGVLC